MAVSYIYPISLPSTPAPESIRPRNRAAVAKAESPYTGQSDKQVYDLQRMVWEVTLPEIDNQTDAYAWSSAFMKLNGKQGSCLYGDPLRSAPRGSYDSGSDTPLIDSTVSGDNADGNRTIVTDGWRTSESGLLVPGDLIQLGSGSTTSLHEVLSQVDSDGSGIAEIDIWPRLRRTLNDNEALTLTNPKGLWELGSNEMPWSITAPMFFGFTFTLVEVIS